MPLTAMPKENKDPKESIRLDPDVMKMARIIVAAEGGSMSSLISDVARAPLRKRFDEVQRKGFNIDPPPQKK